MQFKTTEKRLHAALMAHVKASTATQRVRTRDKLMAALVVWGSLYGTAEDSDMLMAWLEKRDL